MFKIAFIVLVFTTAINGQLIGTEKCSQAESRKFADMTMVATLFGRNATIPDDLPSTTAYCDLAKNSVKGMRTYSRKCLNDFTRHATSMIAYGMNQAVRKACKSDSTKLGL